MHYHRLAQRGWTNFMRRRFLADEIVADRAILTGDHAAHLYRVLRARPGQEFDVAGQGRVRRGRIVEADEKRVVFTLGEDVAGAEAAHPAVHLWLAVFKFDRMEWAIEKATELGAARIVPLITARTEAHLGAAAARRVERWRRIAREASQQSRRIAEPEIAEPEKLRREALAVAGRRLLLSESEKQVSLRVALEASRTPPRAERSTAAESCLPMADAGAGPIHLAVGPEGGWTEAEKKLYDECGWQAVSLGPTILRAETAAVAALAIVLSEIG
jgi:16S rRNA (uracil1498-N3)-methyltransferase